MDADTPKRSTKDERELRQVLRALKNLCVEHGNSNAGRVWAQIKGYLVDRSESHIKMELSADDHMRLYRQIQKRVIESKQLPQGEVVEGEIINIKEKSRVFPF